MRSFAIGTLAFCTALAGAQTASAGSLNERLQNLGAAAEVLRNKLPAFSCHETFTSQELRGRKVKRRVAAAGELRVQPAEDGTLDEDFQASEVNGHPATGMPLAPIFVTGGFKNALQLFLPTDQKCFRFRLNGDHIEFESRSDAPAEACGERTGISGIALFDASGDLVRIESHVEPETSVRRNIVPYAALDLSRVDLGGTTFVLATHAVAEKYLGKTTLRWEATYSNCRLYQVSVRIGAATAAPDDSGK